jgi:hypothetical protein
VSKSNLNVELRRKRNQQCHMIISEESEIIM